MILGIDRKNKLSKIGKEAIAGLCGKGDSSDRESPVVHEDPPKKNVQTHYKGKGYDPNPLEYAICQV